MSSTSATSKQVSLLHQIAELYRNYYWDELGKLIEHYPQERRSLYISYDDLFRKNPDLANDLINHPSTILSKLNDGLKEVNKPVEVDLSQATVRVNDLPDTHIYGVGEIRSDHAGQYIGVEGDISRVTEVRPKLRVAHFRCPRCDNEVNLPQPPTEYQEPMECNGCQRKTDWELDIEHSKLVDRRKVQIKQPPGEAENGEGATMTVYLEGEIADPPAMNLQSRVGEHTVIYGILELDQERYRNQKQPTFTQYLDGYAFEFERDTDEIDVEEYKEEFTNAANSPDAYQKFIESLAPDIYPRGRWPLAFQLGTAWIFGGVRVDPDDGSTYRGDIHMGIFGPPGVGKSKFSQNLAEVAPGAERRSATGLSSDVGLTAAAVQDDFADGDGWVLKPGILPRADSHVILDEADKTSANLSKMNDALEGEQMATIDKGGIKAKLKTRVGLMIGGNPDGGRWDEQKGVKEQIDVDTSLWSRFDGIVFLEDEPDKDEDSELAAHVLDNYSANLAREKGATKTDVDAREPPLSKEALEAWVKFARDNVIPELTTAASEKLLDYYVDIRSDDAYHENSYPTPRKLETGIRYSTAFAKLRLSETVEPQDVDMAISLSKAILGQSLFDGGLDNDVFTEAEEQSQKARKQRILDCIQDDYKSPEQIAEDTGVEISTVKDDLQNWYRKTNPAVVTRNTNGEYKRV